MHDDCIYCEENKKTKLQRVQQTTGSYKTVITISNLTNLDVLLTCVRQNDNDE